MVLDITIMILCIGLGWAVRGFYDNGCDVKKKGFKPLNQRGERLRLFK